MGACTAIHLKITGPDMVAVIEVMELNLVINLKTRRPFRAIVTSDGVLLNRYICRDAYIFLFIDANRKSLFSTCLSILLKDLNLD